jgi:hypothetical protein
MFRNKIWKLFWVAEDKDHDWYICNMFRGGVGLKKLRFVYINGNVQSICKVEKCLGFID